MAAASTPTAPTSAYYNRFSSKTYCLPVSRSISMYSKATKQRKILLIVRNSSDESATVTEAESETAVEVPEGPPSLISALNVEKALRGIGIFFLSLSLSLEWCLSFLGRLLIKFWFRVAAITDADHYGRLGLRTGCSYDEVQESFYFPLP